MEIERVIVNGIVRNGVVVPERDVKLPEGMRVAIQPIQEKIYVYPIKELQSFFDLNPEAFDRLIDIGGAEAVKNLRRIKESLESQFEKDEIDRWLHTPNSRFNGQTPIATMVAGGTDRILGLLIRLEEGIHY